MTQDRGAISRQIACPTCDALYSISPKGPRRCDRCHRVLSAPEKRVGLAVILASLLSVALVYGTFTLPFLSIERFWITRETTLLEAALSFETPLVVLSVAVLFLVLLLPTLRLALNLFVFLPLILSKSASVGAATAFRWSETLRPWSMAEIFTLGCAVALFKITAFATVTFGPAFYMFAALVTVLWVQDRMVCRFGVWQALQ